MRRFTQLFRELDATTRTNDKVAALEAYFRAVPAADAAWALWLLMGQRLPTAVGSRQLRQWAGTWAGLPEWLVDACYEAVGDLAETLALLPVEARVREVRVGREEQLGLFATVTAADETPLREWPLHRVLEQVLVGLPQEEPAEQARRLGRAWAGLEPDERLVFNKLLTGAFRVGVQRPLVVRALAGALGLEPAVLDQRLMGDWRPTAIGWQRLVRAGEGGESDPALPYPFYLASPWEGPAAAPLGDVQHWWVEWKWDGMRAQVIKRAGQVVIWSRGEEMVSERFPEVQGAARHLPDGTVLDGELICWRPGEPLPAGFSALQARLGRKQPSLKDRRENPIVLLAYDLLEAAGQDCRAEPLSTRRERLAAVLALAGSPDALRLPEGWIGASWEALAAQRDQARERGVEGLMLKRRDSPYLAGRVRGAWWKWKVDPLTADLVLVAAQAGHGRRAGLYTDYTFAAWGPDGLFTVAKAYSGLSDDEMKQIDTWVRNHTVAKHGPVRTVAPELVFELGFDAIQPSTRHRSGLAVRFPRVLRWRRDKQPTDADTVDILKRLAEGNS